MNPQAPKVACKHPGCPNTVRPPERFCELHKNSPFAPKPWKGNQGKSSTERGYGARWRKLRARILRDEPLCRICARNKRTVAAVTVDHILNKAQGGTDARSNLQPLCDACHTAKTQREAAEARRNKRNTDND